jgi:hypothetical protein
LKREESEAMLEANYGRKCPVLLAWLIVLSPMALAIDPADVLVFSREPLALKPQLAVSQSYNDNIFYRTDQRVSDFITLVSPGADLQLGRDDANFLALEYRYRHFFYADQDQLNTGEHDIALRSRLLWNRLMITGGDRVQFLSSVLGGAERAVRDQNVERITFFHNYNFAYSVSDKSAVYLEGTYSAVDYEPGVSLYDINTLIGTAGFMFHALPKTSFFGELYYGQTATTPNFAAPKNPHAEFVGGFLGVRGEFTERLTGIAKAGYEVREFSDGTPSPSSPVVDIALSQRFTDKTMATLAYARRHSVSVQFARQTYTANVISARLDQVLGVTGKWRGSLGGSYGNYEYERTDIDLVRQYDIWSLNAGLDYQIQLWLRAGLAYTYERLASQARGFIDYNVNRVTLRMAVGY